MFPEYAEALRLQREGEFRKAAPLFQRMHEVVAASMGEASAPAVFLQRRAAALQVRQGLFKEALAVLRGQAGTVEGVQDPGSRTTAAMVLLLSGDAAAAVRAATGAVELCEQVGVVEAAGAHEQDGFLLLSSSYGALGVSSAYCALDPSTGLEEREQCWEDAEAFLQMAARWSQQQSDPSASCVSGVSGGSDAAAAAQAASHVSTLANLGALCIFRLADKGQAGAEEMGQGEQGVHLPLSLPLLRFECVQAPGLEQPLLLTLPLVKDALGYWEEALQAAQGGSSTGTSVRTLHTVTPTHRPDPEHYSPTRLSTYSPNFPSPLFLTLLLHRAERGCDVRSGGHGYDSRHDHDRHAQRRGQETPLLHHIPRHLHHLYHLYLGLCPLFPLCPLSGAAAAPHPLPGCLLRRAVQHSGAVRAVGEPGKEAGVRVGRPGSSAGARRQPEQQQQWWW
jgi:hypothetical protein